jgi:hypothetical protein
MNRLNGVGRPKLHPDRPRLKIITTAALLLAMSSTLPGVSHAQRVTVVDTLGTATPRTTFSIFGTGGLAISSDDFVGPRFTLTRRSVLTRVGAFVNNCASIISGVPQCPHTRPFVVQIRREVDGRPDPRLVVAAAPLSHDNDPLIVSFESAEFDDVPLEAGTYFALFAPQQAADGGLLLATAPGYIAGITALGTVNPFGSALDPANHAAVQIIARPVDKGRHPKPEK